MALFLQSFHRISKQKGQELALKIETKLREIDPGMGEVYKNGVKKVYAVMKSQEKFKFFIDLTKVSKEEFGRFVKSSVN